MKRLSLTGPPVSSTGPTHSREAIVDAARAVLARDELAGLAVGAVARQAGVHPVTVFRHFPGRNALLHELWRRDRQWRVKLVMALAEALVAGGDARRLLSDHAAAELEYRRRQAASAVLRHLVRTLPLLRAAESRADVSETSAAVEALRRLFPGLPPTRVAAMCRIAFEINAHVFDLAVQHPALESRMVREWRTLWLGYFDSLEAERRAGPAASDFGVSIDADRPRPAPRPARPAGAGFAFGFTFRRRPAAARPVTEDDILAAGDAVLAARGMKGLTARAVARQAGVTVPALRAVFSDQAELLRAIVARDVRGRARLALPLIESMATAPDLAGQIRALLALVRDTRPKGSWIAARRAILSRRELASADEDWQDAWIVPLAGALARRFRNLSPARTAIGARFLIVTHIVMTHFFITASVVGQPETDAALHAEWERMLVGYVTRLGRTDPDPDADPEVKT